MTKIDIVSGFLGAGKTTFIKKLLEEAIAGEKVIIIENEFGEVGIDAGFLKKCGIEVRELNSGCICCSLVGDFGAALTEVLETYKPDRIIIEPSGVGKLSDVVKAVKNVETQVPVTLNSSVTLVDVSKCRMYMKNFGEFFNNQIGYAGTIILSRTDLASADKVEKAVGMIREVNKEAAVITTPYSRLSGRQLLEIIEKPDTMEVDLMKEVTGHSGERGGCGCGKGNHQHRGEKGCGQGDRNHGYEKKEHGQKERGQENGAGCGCGCGGDHQDHHADEVFISWGMENVSPMSWDVLDRVLDELAYGDRFGDVLRAKGMIPIEGDAGWNYFDLVPEQYEIHEGEPEYTGKVCVIGANLKEDELKKAFGRR